MSRSEIPAKTRQVIYDRADWRCEVQIPQACGTGIRAMAIHHRKLRRAKDHSVPNLLLLCKGCHDFIHAHPAQSYANGWLVHSYEDPTLIEVKSYRRDG